MKNSQTGARYFVAAGAGFRVVAADARLSRDA